MNAEQKAFYEYGKAFERMNSTKKRLRGIWHSDKCIRTRIGQAAIIGPRHKRNVKDAWQKRAACRAWIPPQRRGCSTCKHDGTHYKLCALCHGVGWPISWKPKKEGES